MQSLGLKGLSSEDQEKVKGAFKKLFTSPDKSGIVAKLATMDEA